MKWMRKIILTFGGRKREVVRVQMDSENESKAKARSNAYAFWDEIDGPIHSPPMGEPLQDVDHFPWDGLELDPLPDGTPAFARKGSSLFFVVDGTGYEAVDDNQDLYEDGHIPQSRKEAEGVLARIPYGVTGKDLVDMGWVKSEYGPPPTMKINTCFHTI